MAPHLSPASAVRPTTLPCHSASLTTLSIRAVSRNVSPPHHAAMGSNAEPYDRIASPRAPGTGVDCYDGSSAERRSSPSLGVTERRSGTCVAGGGEISRQARNDRGGCGLRAGTAVVGGASSWPGRDTSGRWPGREMSGRCRVWFCRRRLPRYSTFRGWPVYSTTPSATIMPPLADIASDARRPTDERSPSPPATPGSANRPR